MLEDELVVLRERDDMNGNGIIVSGSARPSKADEPNWEATRMTCSVGSRCHSHSNH
jgi:hypothetical protein